ncbi:hypothetical protein AGR4C_Lc90176 [Agrobacterium tumefaciens str. Kerr 14]|uniref:Uncharacterized protein n=1 Tax=Agrobacterium tumefaciens str. Kerr 14 TaxID=1183424 RepID=A0A1S7S7M2_AGRTU|nr:hypothetical protein AGR4C_Lc90176 [Agrobacterium tumefaciens str. Kerr 14]
MGQEPDMSLEILTLAGTVNEAGGPVPAKIINEIPHKRDEALQTRQSSDAARRDPGDWHLGLHGRVHS